MATPYAVVRSGGHQYRLKPGDIVDVERLAAENGTEIAIGEVLLAAQGSDIHVGSPVLDDVKVIAKVLSEPKGDKLIIFKYKKRKRERRKNGHRQIYTRVRVLDIQAPWIVREAAAAPAAEAPATA